MTENKTESKSYTQQLCDHLRLTHPGLTNDVFDSIKSFAMDFADAKSQQQKAQAGLMTFGKYKNKQIADIFALDPVYVRWLKKSEKYLNQTQKEIVDDLLKTTNGRGSN